MQHKVIDMGEKPNIVELVDKGYYSKESIAKAIKEYYRKKLTEHGKSVQANMETQIAFGISEKTVYKYIR